MGHAAYGLKVSDALTDEAQELTDRVKAVLVLIKAKSLETPDRGVLLEKEASCCNLATD